MWRGGQRESLELGNRQGKKAPMDLYMAIESAKGRPTEVDIEPPTVGSSRPIIAVII